MSDKKEFKQLKKLTKREERWIIGEFSWLNKLKKSIEEKDKKTALRVARGIGRSEIYLNRISHQGSKSNWRIKNLDLSEKENKIIDQIEKEINKTEPFASELK